MTSPHFLADSFAIENHNGALLEHPHDHLFGKVRRAPRIRPQPHPTQTPPTHPAPLLNPSTQTPLTPPPGPRPALRARYDLFAVDRLPAPHTAVLQPGERCRPREQEVHGQARPQLGDRRHPLVLPGRAHPAAVDERPLLTIPPNIPQGGQQAFGAYQELLPRGRRNCFANRQLGRQRDHPAGSRRRPVQGKIKMFVSIFFFLKEFLTHATYRATAAS